MTGGRFKTFLDFDDSLWLYLTWPYIFLTFDIAVFPVFLLSTEHNVNDQSNTSLLCYLNVWTFQKDERLFPHHLRSLRIPEPCLVSAFPSHITIPCSSTHLPFSVLFLLSLIFHIDGPVKLLSSVIGKVVRGKVSLFFLDHYRLQRLLMYTLFFVPICAWCREQLSLILPSAWNINAN